MENSEEVVEIVFNCCRDLPSNDPMKSLREEVEDVWSGLQAKDKRDVMVEAPFPRVPQKSPVEGPDVNLTESQRKASLRSSLIRRAPGPMD